MKLHWDSETGLRDAPIPIEILYHISKFADITESLDQSQWMFHCEFYGTKLYATLSILLTLGGERREQFHRMRE